MTNHLTGRTVTVDGKQYLYFGGTSYLGLPYNETYQRFFAEGMSRYGTALGSSPLSEPALSVYKELEKDLATRMDFDHAVLFQSGFLAGQAVVAHLHQSKAQFQYSEMAHPAIKSEQPIRQSFQPKAWLSDYIEPVSLATIEQLQKPSEIDLYVIDASHAIGLLDQELQQYVEGKPVLVTASLNKALGTAGGVVLYNGPELPIKKLVQYTTASPPSPAACYALLQSFKTGLIQQQQRKLQDLLSPCSPASQHYHFKPGFPVLVLQDSSQQLFDEFQLSGQLIWRNTYPKGSGNILNRIVITAEHTNQDVQELLARFS